MAKTQKVSRIKVKKKRWFPVLAPKFLGQREIGESYLSELKAAVGRVLKISLRELTRNVKDQNICVSLKITEASGNSLQTEVVGYAYLPFFIGKLIRAGTGKIDDSFILKTKDDKAVRFKPLAITVFPVNRSIKTAIRKKLRDSLEEEAGKSTFDSLVNDLLRYKLQAELKKKLNKVCPIREIIMRAVKLEGRKKVEVKKKEEIPPKLPVSKEEISRPPTPSHPPKQGSKTAEKVLEEE